MVEVTRRYRFASSHRLHSPLLPEEANWRLYGKCNNPFGHGHNYVLDITVGGPVDEVSGQTVNRMTLDGLVKEQVIEPFDRRNLNADVEAFAGEVVPTTENLAVEIHRRLSARWLEVFPGGWPRLQKIRIEETGRNIFQIDGCDEAI